MDKPIILHNDIERLGTTSAIVYMCFLFNSDSDGFCHYSEREIHEFISGITSSQIRKSIRDMTSCGAIVVERNDSSGRHLRRKAVTGLTNNTVTTDNPVIIKKCVDDDVTCYGNYQDDDTLFKYRRFISTVKSECHFISGKYLDSFTIEQYSKLLDIADEHIIIQTAFQLENYSKREKYKSLYLTLNNWIKRTNGNGRGGKTRQEEEKSRRESDMLEYLSNIT